MATIKTKTVGGARHIITKLINGQRRVSCSCCDEAECCMYPADQLGIGYTEEDLPDQIEVFDGTDTFIYNKNGSIYEFQNQSLRVEAGIGWVPFLDEDEIGDRDQPCLIAPNDTLRVTDLFEDTYTITASDPDPLFQGCASITRVNLCTWHHPLQECDLTATLRGIIFYNDGTLTLNDQLLGPHGWYYDFGQENFVRKNDPQNSPEGIYDFGFVSYTISQ